MRPPRNAGVVKADTNQVFVRLRALCGWLLSSRRLEERKHRALGVGDNRPGPHALHRLWRHKNLAAQLGGLRRRCLHVARQKVDQPMRWDLRIAMLGRRDAADETFSVLDVEIA